MVKWFRMRENGRKLGKVYKDIQDKGHPKEDKDKSKSNVERSIYIDPDAKKKKCFQHE